MLKRLKSKSLSRDKDRGKDTSKDSKDLKNNNERLNTLRTVKQSNEQRSGSANSVAPSVDYKPDGDATSNISIESHNSNIRESQYQNNSQKPKTPLSKSFVAQNYSQSSIDSNNNLKVNGNIKEQKQPKIELMKPKFTNEQSEKLANTVINKHNKNLPYGDGSEKLFGIENYGYNCYVSSIFQCLYHTKQFREAILQFPTRDENNQNNQRPRKFNVEGRNKNTIPHCISSLNNNTHSNTNSNLNNDQASHHIPPIPTSSSSSNGNGNSVRKLFSRSNTDNSSTTTVGTVNNNGNSNDNENNHNSSNDNDDITYIQSDFGINPKQQDEALERKITKRYPAFKNLELNYYRNSQRNLTVVGIIKDTNALLEWRKKAALIRGPIINLDEGFNLQYGMENENMFTVIKDAFECIAENYSNTGVLTPFNLIEVIKRENIMFRNAQHQDAHEFLNFLINNILENVKLLNNEKIISDTFEGEVTSETKCLTCDTSSYRDEKFLDLSIDLEPDSSITNCLKIFSKIELLNENNKFYCENCFSYQEAAKSVKIKKTPKILTFHLKRFKYSEKLGRLVKLFYRVEYVKNLRICNTTNDSDKPDKLYELYGVVVHIGGGPYHGHYVSLVKTEHYGWLLFDDETVEKINENYVFKFFGDGVGLSTAYLLFYREVEDEEEYMRKQLDILNEDEEDEDDELGDDEIEEESEEENGDIENEYDTTFNISTEDHSFSFNDTNINDLQSQHTTSVEEGEKSEPKDRMPEMSPINPFTRQFSPVHPTPFVQKDVLESIEDESLINPFNSGDQEDATGGRRNSIFGFRRKKN